MSCDKTPVAAGAGFQSPINRFYMSGQGATMNYQVGLDEPWMLVYWRMQIDKTTTAAQVKVWLLSAEETDYSDGTTYTRANRHRVILWDTDQSSMGLTLAKDIVVRVPWDELPAWSFRANDKVQFFSDDLQSAFPWGIEVGLLPERYWWGRT